MRINLILHRGPNLEPNIEGLRKAVRLQIIDAVAVGPAINTKIGSLQPTRYRLSVEWKEESAVAILNWLAQWNAELLRRLPETPLLYDSGAVYKQEPGVEVWMDILCIYAKGFDDCDGLACARAGELLAKGGSALKSGETYHNKVSKPLVVDVFLRTRSEPEAPKLYHCLVRYRPSAKHTWAEDDPSARLGMLGTIDQKQADRWARAKGHRNPNRPRTPRRPRNPNRVHPQHPKKRVLIRRRRR